MLLRSTNASLALKGILKLSGNIIFSSHRFGLSGAWEFFLFKLFQEHLLKNHWISCTLFLQFYVVSIAFQCWQPPDLTIHCSLNFFGIYFDPCFSMSICHSPYHLNRYLTYYLRCVRVLNSRKFVDFEWKKKRLILEERFCKIRDGTQLGILIFTFKVYSIFSFIVFISTRKEKNLTGKNPWKKIL